MYLPRALALFCLVSSLSYPADHELLLTTSAVTPDTQDSVVLPGFAQRVEEVRLELSNEITAIDRR